MRILTHIVTAQEDGATVKHLLRQRFALSSSLLKSIKWRSGGITLNGMPVTVAVCPWRLKRNGNRLSSIVLTLVKQVVLNSNTANVILRLSLPQNNHRSKPAPHTPKKRHAVDASFRKRRTFTALPMYTPLRFTSGSSIVSETEKAVSRLNFSCRKDGTHVMMPSFKRPWIHAARQTGASVSTSCCVLFFSGRVLRTFP